MIPKIKRTVVDTEEALRATTILFVKALDVRGDEAREQAILFSRDRLESAAWDYYHALVEQEPELKHVGFDAWANDQGINLCQSSIEATQSSMDVLRDALPRILEMIGQFVVLRQQRQQAPPIISPDAVNTMMDAIVKAKKANLPELADQLAEMLAESLRTGQVPPPPDVEESDEENEENGENAAQA